MKFQRIWQKKLKIIPDALLCSSDQRTLKYTDSVVHCSVMDATKYVSGVSKNQKAACAANLWFSPLANVCRNGNEIQLRCNKICEGWSNLLLSTLCGWFWYLLSKKCCKEGQRSCGKLFSDSALSILKCYQKAKEREWILQEHSVSTENIYWLYQ